VSAGALLGLGLSGLGLAVVWGLGGIYARARRLRLRRASFVFDASAPSVSPDLFGPTLARLQRAGFTQVGAVISLPAQQLTDTPTVDPLMSREDGVWAWVHAPLSLSAGRPIAVDFVTLREDGTLRFTLAMELPGRLDPPAAEVACSPTLSIGRRLAAHVFAVESASSPARSCSAGSLVAAVEAAHWSAVEAALAAGELEQHPRATDRLRLTARAARKLSAQVVRGLPAALHSRDGGVQFGPPEPRPSGLPPEHGARVHRELEALAGGSQARMRLHTRWPRVEAAVAAGLALWVWRTSPEWALDPMWSYGVALALVASVPRRLRVARVLDIAERARKQGADPLVTAYAALSQAGFPAAGTRAGFALAGELAARLGGSGRGDAAR
jgi:hypothetical protein